MTDRVVVSDGSVEEIIEPDGVSGHVSKRPNDRPLPPSEDAFNEEDFLEAPEVRRIAIDLIATCTEFKHLREPQVRIEYAWKAQGGKSKGADVYGKCTKLGGPAKYFAGCDWFIWIAADHVRESAWTNLQLEALIYHELTHIGCRLDENENSPTYNQFILYLVSHDYEVFDGELLRYGAWNRNRRNLITTAKQIPLAQL